ncbi:hypothetical protein J1614_010901 [Plenodomus biglobosus]|nr:hypothetical protein J1614_010901 [Plenodomus biglobosus]
MYLCITSHHYMTGGDEATILVTGGHVSPSERTVCPQHLGMHNATALNHAAKNCAAPAIAMVRSPSHLTLLPTFFTPMALRVGQALRGLKGQYELLHPLKGSTVFKAKVLSSPIKERWAMVKTAVTEGEKMCLTREYHNYGINEISSSPFIRALRDTIWSKPDQDGPSCLVFEWMDQDLESVPAPTFRGSPKLPKVVSKAVLSALSVFKTLDAVHTDISPNNIFVSDAIENSPVAKLGDLGNMIMDGSAKIRVQSLPARAPEVWQGFPCRHSSDVWSFAATKLTYKLSPLGLFGPGDKLIEGHTEAYCIAKIICLVGPLSHQVTCEAYKEEFELAEQLAVMNHPLGPMKLIDRGNWRKELQDIPDPPVPQDLLDFIEFLLVIDPDKRPTASDALQHPYLQSVTTDRDSGNELERDS